MSLKQYLGTPYKLSSSENFDEYMKALGVGVIARKMGNMVTPTVTLTEKDGVYTLTTSSTFKNSVIHFQPDVEFEEETVDGRKVMSTVHIEGNVVTHTQKGERTTVIVREYYEDKMIATMTIGNVKCVRVYEKAQ